MIKIKKIQCADKDCNHIFELDKSGRHDLLKIGNSWHCGYCRGYKFIIVELEEHTHG